ncbi:MAG: hypothetical protein NTZ17_03000 [Phycisphaerae bacterium]|nr:hypothetical protein [Phycisphaerae bacterium]
MGKKKVIRHMGMTMTAEEHRRWHQEHAGKRLTAGEHRKLMGHLGVSPEQDRRWHKAQEAGEGESPAEPAPEGEGPQVRNIALGSPVSVNPFAIGGGFLEYCVKQGWLTRQRRGRATKYYVTEAGREALAGYGITKY